ncbi:MAG TPA: hypothetical protein VIS94_10795 [Desulfomonilia bacterium]|jgi:SOS response regulatory protein OraA/RecX
MKSFDTKEEAVSYCLNILSRRAVSSFELKKNFQPGALTKG